MMHRRLVLVGIAVALALVVPLSSVPAATQPSPPAGLTAIALNGAVELGWQPSAGATGYAVYRGTSKASIGALLTSAAGVTATTYDDSTGVNGTTYYYVVRAVTSGIESMNSATISAASQTRSCSTGNPVVLENCYPGSTGWHADNTSDVSAGGIEGFASANSINKGGSVDLKINAGTAAPYHIEIYRSGYYGGTGGRLFSRIENLSGVRQPVCTSFPTTTGVVDCSNWSVAATITTTAAWPSGVYLLRLVRDDTGFDNQILLAVRDDSRASDLLYGVNFCTYEAYNSYGGKSLYNFNSTGANTVSGTPRAVAVSFDRPFDQSRTGPSVDRDWYPNIDYPLVYWLEKSGYDISYESNTDLETQPDSVRSHLAYVTPVHDEYYSATMRNAVQSARDLGVSMFFTGGNEMYWKTRFIASPVTGAANRVIVNYKTTQGGPADPSGIPTGTWRDPNGANNPENAFIGVMYVGDNDLQPFPMTVDAAQGNDRVYRHTNLQNQQALTSTTFGTQLVGWEWDARVANNLEPPGLKTLSASAVNGGLVQSNGAYYISGSTTVNSTKYTAASGALVFATGTNNWARGLALDGAGTGDVNLTIQQVTTNVLSDMGTYPQTPAADLVVDTTRPDAPTATGASGGTTSTSISWNAVLGVDGYNVYRTLSPRTAGGLGQRVNSTPLLGTSFSDTGLQPNTTYYYVVTSVSGATQSVASNEVAVHTDPLPAPQVSTSSPLNGATGVSTAASVRASFTRAMDPATITSSSFRLQAPGGSVVPATVSYSATANQALLRPTSRLSTSTTYTAVLSQTITATDAAPLAAQVTWSFTTGAVDPAPPTVLSTVPSNNQTFVARGGPINVTFSQSMTGSSLTSSAIGVVGPDGALSGTVAYDDSTHTASLQPDALLAPNTTYTATVDSSVEAADGTPLGAPFTWTFTTAACPCSLFSTVLQPGQLRLSVQDGRFGAGPWSYELGVKLAVDEQSTLTALRFFKAPDEIGVHTGKVWTSSGLLLASVDFTNETATGWQRQQLPTPLTLTPNVTYIVSVNANAYFGMTQNGLLNQITSGPLHTVLDGLNGVYANTGGVFPSQSFRTSNYFTDAEIVPAGDPPALTLTSKSPADGADGVKANSTVNVVFSRQIDPATLSGANFTLRDQGGALVGASVAYDATTHSATLTPAGNLVLGASYTARLTGIILASDGKPLATPITWQFTVEGPPTVTSTSPTGGASGVSTNTSISASFSRPLDPTTINASTFSVKTGAGTAVSGTVVYEATARVATFRPTSPLTLSTAYTATLAAGISSTSSLPMSAAYSWTFTTATTPPSPPTVTAQTPASGATLVSHAPAVTATFSRAMDQNSLTPATVTLTGPAGLVATTVAYDSSSKTATLSSVDALLGNTTYTARIDSAVQAADGTPLGAAVSWSFTTAPCPCSLFAASLVPALTGLPVQDGRFGIGPWSYEFGVKFTVDQTELLKSIRFYKDPLESGLHTGRLWIAGSGGGVLLSTVDFANESVSGWQEQALPSPVQLQPGTTYMVSVNANAFFSLTFSALTAQIDNGALHSVADGANGAYAASAGQFPNQSYRASNYFVDVVVDRAPLSVAGTSPGNGATGVALVAPVRVTFNRDVDGSTVSGSSVSLSSPDGSTVSAAVSYDSASHTVTLQPSAPLAYSTTYTAHLSSAVRTSDGAVLAPYTFTFTTTAPPAPSVTRTAPTDGATSVSTAATIRATFSLPLDPATVTASSFRLSGPGGFLPASVIYDAATSTAVLTPASPLSSGVTYTASLSSSIAATTGGTLTQYVWSFTVSSASGGAFSVSSFTPADGATGVGRQSTVTVTFDRSIDPTTLTASTFQLQAANGSTVAAALSYDDSTHTATLTPSGALDSTAAYTATVTTGITATDGSTLASALHSGFTTAACPCSLFAASAAPAFTGNPVQDGRGGAGPWSYEFGMKFVVDQPVSLAAVRFYKDPLETGAHTARIWTANGTQIATVDFTSETASGWQEQAMATPLQLQPGTTYVVSVNANAFFGLTIGGLAAQIDNGALHSVADGANGAYAASAGQFPNQSYRASNYFVDVVVDRAPLSVAGTSPGNGATGVALVAPVRVTFNRDVDGSTVSGSSVSLSSPDGSTVSAAVSYDSASHTVTLQPSAPLAYSTTYTAHLSSAVRTSDGAVLAPYTFTFTTTAPPAPSVTRTAPTDGATSVSTAATIRATFSLPLDPATVTASSFRLSGPGGFLPASVIYDAATSTAVLTPASPLSSGVTYTASLSSSIAATTGGTLTQYVWSFTVSSASGGAFSVSSFTPADGATGVGRQSTVTVTFDRSIDPTTLTASTFQLQAANGSTVAAALSYDDSTHTATLTPSGALDSTAAYTATVTTGITATDGTPLGGGLTWSFTTAACDCSLFSTALVPAAGGNPVQDGRGGAGPWSYEFGMKFVVDQPVSLAAVRFYKDPLETGAHTARIWTANGTQIATVDFTSETASGWQEQAMATPLQLQPGTTYVVSVNANAFFGLTIGGLAAQINDGALHSVADGLNGVYGDSAGTFPTSSFRSSNYFVDVMVR